MDKCDLGVMRKHVGNRCHKNVGSYLKYITDYGATRYEIIIC